MADETQVTFATFVMSLATTAAVHFGDIADPVSGAKQPDLASAGQLIDILSMLQDKTKGNLTLEERQLLDQLLYELRMRYVDVRQDSPRIIQP